MAHRYRLYPTADQQLMLVMHCAHARFVWNLALEQWRCWRPGRRPAPGAAERMRQLAEARQHSWLGGGASSVQQQALRDFDQALRNFFAGTHQRPSWRKGGRHEGFCVRDVKVRNLNRRWSKILVPKCGWVRFRLSRPLPAGHGMARLTRDRAGRWHVAFAAPQSSVERRPRGSAVGIDRGVATTIATSDGVMLRAPKLAERRERRLVRLSRRLSRQLKGSNRRAKTKARVGVINARLADRRRDWVERQTTRLVRENDPIAVEHLNVKGMVRRPALREDPDTPGVFLPNGARAKAGLNRAIHANCWGLFARRLRDKAAASGVLVIEVDPCYTSQECRACRHVAPENRESQAVFRCQECGHIAHADRNAAENILARGLQVLAPTPGHGARHHDGAARVSPRRRAGAAGTSEEAA